MIMRMMILNLWSVRLQNENKYLGNLDKLQNQNHKILPPLANKTLSLSQGVCVCESRSVMSDSLRPHGLYSPWNSPGQNTGVCSFSFLQGIFPTQGSNPGLLHYRWILYQFSHKGSPRTLEWVPYSFSRDLPNPGIEPGSPALQADSLPTELSGELLFPRTHHLSQFSPQK